MTAVHDLRAFLNTNGPGRVQDKTSLIDLLGAAWPTLSGCDQGSMHARKLARLESPVWDPPRLSFTLERHGGTVLGSTRADPQRWTVDLETRTAESETAGHRQLEPMAERVDLVNMARGIADAADTGKPHSAVEWTDKNHVRVRVGILFPKNGGFRMTQDSRRRTLRRYLAEEFGGRGWIQDGRDTYARVGRAMAASGRAQRGTEGG